MVMPKQVQKQMQEVQEIEDALNAQRAQPDDVPPTEPAVQPTPSAEPTQLEQPPVEPAPATPPQPAADQWEQRYKSLKGIFEAEVPRLQQQNKDLVKQVLELKSAVESMQAAKPAPVEEPLVTDKDVSAFGEDLIDVQRRVAREVMRDVVAPLKAELDAKDVKIAQLEAKLGKTSGDLSALSFEQRLEMAIPGFSKMNNTDKGWIAYLDAVDDFTGHPRRLFAEHAYAAGDVEGVARVVEHYRRTTKPSEVPARSSELERQVAPTRSASAASAAPAGERFYTEAEATRLFNKVRELYAAGKNDEALKIENDITLAYATGRVRA